MTTELARIGNFQIATLLQMPKVAVGNIHLFRRIVMATLFESSLQIVFMQSVKRIVCTGSEWTQSRTTGKYSIAYWIVHCTGQRC